MAEIVVKGTSVYLVDRNGQQTLQDLVFDATADYDLHGLLAMRLALNNALRQVDEQILLTMMERERDERT